MKSVKYLILIALLCFFLSGCERQTPKETAEFPKETSAEKVDDKSLYESFLNNEAKVHINKDVDFGQYFSFKEEGELYYTLDEIANLFYESHTFGGAEASLDNVSYAYIDCGKNGISELLIKIDVSNSGAEYWTENIVIKNINDNLETVYTQDAWLRSRVRINEYGYVYNDGSGGAAYSVFQKNYIDADGKLNFIYECYTESDVVVYAEDCILGYDGSKTVGISESDASKYEGRYARITFCFTEDEKHIVNNDAVTFGKQVGEALNEYYKNYYYNYNLEEVLNANSEDSFFRVVTDYKGIPFYSLEEINKMISDREKEIGLTDEIKNAEEPEMISIN